MKAALRRSPLASRRFVPPWERSGQCAEDFFGGLMDSQNPLERQRRDEQRSADYEAEAATRFAQEQMERERIAAEINAMDALKADEEQQRLNFLPYGATPRKYFANTEMVAWGQYHTQLGQQRAYSTATSKLLQADMDTKLPYKFDALPKETVWPLFGTCGLVIDIDGVVYRSKKLIEGSDTAIQQLVKLKVPFCFMTNGGGLTESARARQLSELLACDIHEDQILLSHSPMQLLAPEYENKPVLIVGGWDSVKVARHYGFRHAIGTEEFMLQHPELVPFKRWSGEVQPAAPRSIPFPEFAAIFQFTDPSDTFQDIQLAIDVMVSPKGQICELVGSQQSVPYFNSADDLLWATEAPLPRLGQGAFREMLAAVYESVTGGALQTTAYGKPRAIAYAYAERQLAKVTQRLGWNPDQLRSICMVGDNIETDILGANARGGKWLSVHVLSGLGRTPAARRTLSRDDDEALWLEENISKVPHYVAPTLDHFVRELLAFPEDAVHLNKTRYFGPPCPVDIAHVYRLPHL